MDNFVVANALKEDHVSKLIPISEELLDRYFALYGYVPAGYPSEADNYIEPGINLNKIIIRNRSKTKCTWATHKGMTGEGIDITDLLVIDEGLTPGDDSVLLYYIDNEFTLRRIKYVGDQVELIPLHPEVKSIILGPGENLEKIGVLTYVIKKYSIYKESFGDYPVTEIDYLEKGMDFDQYVMGDDWETRFYIRCGGDSMKGDGIEKDDLLLFDGMKDANKDSIIVFSLNREYTIKRVVKYKEYCELVSSNPEYKPIRVTDGDELSVMGTLITVIKKFV